MQDLDFSLDLLSVFTDCMLLYPEQVKYCIIREKKKDFVLPEIQRLLVRMGKFSVFSWFLVFICQVLDLSIQFYPLLGGRWMVVHNDLGDLFKPWWFRDSSRQMGIEQNRKKNEKSSSCFSFSVLVYPCCTFNLKNVRSVSNVQYLLKQRILFLLIFWFFITFCIFATLWGFN